VSISIDDIGQHLPFQGIEHIRRCSSKDIATSGT